MAGALGGRRGADTHPATRTFSGAADRENEELSALEASTPHVDVLAPGGRLVVIAFHSLEDRIVKHFIAAETAECVCPPEMPVCVCDQRPACAKSPAAVKPGCGGVATNPRARSAMLRVAERLPDDASRLIHLNVASSRWRGA